MSNKDYYKSLLSQLEELRTTNREVPIAAFCRPQIIERWSQGVGGINLDELKQTNPDAYTKITREHLDGTPTSSGLLSSSTESILDNVHAAADFFNNHSDLQPTLKWLGAACISFIAPTYALSALALEGVVTGEFDYATAVVSGAFMKWLGRKLFPKFIKWIASITVQPLARKLLPDILQRLMLRSAASESISAALGIETASAATSATAAAGASTAEVGMVARLVQWLPKINLRLLILVVLAAAAGIALGAIIATCIEIAGGGTSLSIEELKQNILGEEAASAVKTLTSDVATQISQLFRKNNRSQPSVSRMQQLVELYNKAISKNKTPTQAMEEVSKEEGFILAKSL